MARINFDEDQDPLDGLDESEEGAAQQEQAAPSSEELFPTSDEQVEQTEEESDDIKMDDVDERLEVAQCYRILLRESLFSKANPAAKKVDKQIRGFVRQQLAILMGIAPAGSQAKSITVAAQFDDSEVAVLKQIVARAREAAQRTISGTPVLNKAGAAPQPKPVTVQKAALPAPQTRKPAVTPPAPMAKAEAPKPVAKPQAAKPVNDSRVPERFRKDPTLTFKGGKAFVQARNSDDEPLWVYDGAQKKRTPMLKDVTLPARPAPGTPQPLPMPGIARSGNGFEDQSNSFMQAQADSMIGFAERKAVQQNIGRLLVGTLAQNIQPNADGE